MTNNLWEQASKKWGESQVMEATEIETSAESLDVSIMFHLTNDILGFMLYMYQQIPLLVISLYSLFFLFFF